MNIIILKQLTLDGDVITIEVLFGIASGPIRDGYNVKVDSVNEIFVSYTRYGDIYILMDDLTYYL